jgi:CMP-N,N'-diacetyllegionaminic acid synthase
VQQYNSFLAIIPARKGSKGIPGKNLKKIAGKPMIQFTIEAAISVISSINIIISTDDYDVLNLSEKLGLEVPFIRPDSLSTDSAKTSDVIQHSLDWYQSKYNKLPANIILLQPTSPFRNANDIGLAINKFNQSPKKTLISASDPIQHPGDCILKDQDGQFKRLEIGKGIYGRQSYPEVLYIDGGIYISETSHFIETQNMIGDDPEVFKTEKFNSIDIDTPFDLDLARALYNFKKTNDL